MRIVKTTKTINTKKWIARKLWDGRNINTDEQNLLKSIYGNNIVVLLPQTFHKEESNFLNIFEETRV